MSDCVCHFGLIVTGKGEKQFLPAMFGTLMARAWCKFTVIRWIGQRSPITAPKRLLKMVGRGGRLLAKDEQEIGLPALVFLRAAPHRFVLLIDDLEHGRRDNAAAVFGRYRTAFDEALRISGLDGRAGVFFFVNMLEAYYFAHSSAVNNVAGAQVLQHDHPTDVEQIRHPKNQLGELWPGFDEVQHGDPIVQQLDISHVLSRSAECCWLRALFAWCVCRLRTSQTTIFDDGLFTDFCMATGCQEPLVSGQ